MGNYYIREDLITAWRGYETNGALITLIYNDAGIYWESVPYSKLDKKRSEEARKEAEKRLPPND